MEPFGFDHLPEVVRQLFEKIERIELRLQNLQEVQPATKTLVSIDSAAEYLGISKQALYTMCSRGIIQYYKPGKRLYFDIAKLEEWIRAKPISPIEERIERLSKQTRPAYRFRNKSNR